MPMRKIAIIGAGQAGLLAAHALLNKQYDVTLYSDRTAENFLHNTRPTGVAGRFSIALDFERELGLNYWEKEAAWVDYAHVLLCPDVNNRLMTLCGRLAEPACAIDLRLQSHRWMLEFEKKGGRIVIENVSPSKLDEIANEHELTLVSSGRGELQRLFERDPERSTHSTPPRKLMMIGITGPKMGFEGAPGLPVRFHIFPNDGECFWNPWLHKDHGHSWALLIEAKPGKRFDIFENIDAPQQLLDTVKQCIRKYMPWDYAWVKDAVLADEHAWLVGSFIPQVKKPVAKLPSGKIVMPIGDTAISVDPIAGQGANCGNKMVKNLIQCIEAHEDRPFDSAWMINTFEKFWARHKAMVLFTDILLNDMTAAGKELFIAQYGSTGRSDDTSVQQLIANAIAENFNDPALYTAAFSDVKEARKLIERISGDHWLRTTLKGVVKIGKGQIRQKFGLDPMHPSTVPFSLKGLPKV
jgi:Styrene monooxygenase A putative substrate binding domain